MATRKTTPKPLAAQRATRGARLSDPHFKLRDLVVILLVCALLIFGLISYLFFRINRSCDHVQQQSIQAAKQEQAYLATFKINGETPNSVHTVPVDGDCVDNPNYADTVAVYSVQGMTLEQAHATVLQSFHGFTDDSSVTTGSYGNVTSVPTLSNRIIRNNNLDPNSDAVLKNYDVKYTLASPYQCAPVCDANADALATPQLAATPVTLITITREL